MRQETGDYPRGRGAGKPPWFPRDSKSAKIFCAFAHIKERI